MILPGWCGLKSSHQPPGPGVEFTVQVRRNKSESGGADTLSPARWQRQTIENVQLTKNGNFWIGRFLPPNSNYARPMMNIKVPKVALECLVGLILFASAAYFLINRPDPSVSETTRTEGTRSGMVEITDGTKDGQSDSSVAIISDPSPPSRADGSDEAQAAARPADNSQAEKGRVGQNEAIPTDTRGGNPLSQSGVGVSDQARVAPPVAFAEDSPNPNLSEEQMAEINALRSQFVEKVGGYNQDPSDPKYGARWEKARQLADEQLRTQLGEEAFAALQNESVTHTNSVSPED